MAHPTCTTLLHSHTLRKDSSRRERDRKRAAAHQAHIRAQADLESDLILNAHDEAVSAEGSNWDDKTVKQPTVNSAVPSLEDEFCSDESYVQNNVKEDTLVEKIVVEVKVIWPVL